MHLAVRRLGPRGLFVSKVPKHAFLLPVLDRLHNVARAEDRAHGRLELVKRPVGSLKLGSDGYVFFPRRHSR